MSILDFAAIAKAAGLKQPAAVRRWLKSRGIAFMADSGGLPITTVDAFNRALYGQSNRPDFSKPCCPRKSTRNTGATTTSTRIGGTRSHG
ncbi:MAG: DUF4224 domain-containing protein [Lautropia sp.]